MTTPASHGEAFDAFEAAGWEHAADAYDEFFGPITHTLIDPILDATGVTTGTRLLDIACGARPRRRQSRGTRRSAGRHRRRPRHDPSGTDRPPRSRRRHGDAHQLPFPDATFDVVTANFAILHLSDPERAASEFARVLTPGGHVALTVWDQPEHARLFGWILEAIAAAGRPSTHRPPCRPTLLPFRPRPRTRNAPRCQRLRGRHGPNPHLHAPGSVEHRNLDRHHRRIRAHLGADPTTAPAVQQAIRLAFNDLVASDASSDEIEIPFSVKLATARTRQRNAA